jgi:hypothetical protein
MKRKELLRAAGRQREGRIAAWASGFLVVLLIIGMGIGFVGRWYFKRSGSGNEAQDFSHQKPAVGDRAPDFVLRSFDNKEFHLKDRIGQKPIVIEFGSIT